MLSSNNPELDPELLAEKLKSVALHRRRPRPLFLKPKASDFTQGLGYPSQTTGLRGLIKRIPLLGPAAVALNRKVRQIMLPGLTWKRRLLLTPVIGAIAHWTYSVLHLSRIRQDFAQQLTELRLTQQAIIDEMATLDIENRLRRLDAMNVKMEQRLDKIESAVTAVVTTRVIHENRIAGLLREMHQLQLAVVTTATPSSPAPVQVPKQAPLPASPPPGFDIGTFYSEFEDVFRGSRAEIGERLKVYLPYLAHFRGDASARIVDVGCGRGEWLELLQSEGLQSHGVDMNSVMVADCHNRGLKADCEDAIAYLRRQPVGSVAAVTGFHIIEHLPFDGVIALLDAALRALREDGMIIFETPNPENLQVGACNFYSDPTHLHPIVPAVAEFMARQRGFAHAEIRRLHPYPDYLQLVEDSDVARRVNQVLYGPQDYAVIAWKSYAN